MRRFAAFSGQPDSAPAIQEDAGKQNMGRKSFLLRSIAASLAFASTSWALSVGKVKVNSYLMQPLDAQIELEGVDQALLADLRIGVGDRDDFARLQIDPEALPVKLSLTPKQVDGRWILQATSNEPVAQPYIEFPLRIQGKGINLVKDVTVLLDPRKAVKPAAAEAPAATTRPLPQRPKQDQKQNLAGAGPQPMFDGQGHKIAPRISSYKVKPGETLWPIAYYLRSDEVTSQQMMIALQRLNPGAFEDGNINKLRSGVELVVPTTEQVKRINRGEALSDFARQEQAWKHGEPLPQPPSRPAAGARAPEAAASEGLPVVEPAVERTMLPSGASSDKLEVLPSREQTPPQAAESSPLEPLKQDLLLQQETLASGDIEEGNIRRQLVHLKAQVQEMQQLLAFKDQQIATLQAIIEAQRVAAGLPPAKHAPVAPTPAPEAAPTVPSPTPLPPTDSAASQALNAPAIPPMLGETAQPATAEAPLPPEAPGGTVTADSGAEPGTTTITVEAPVQTAAPAAESPRQATEEAVANAEERAVEVEVPDDTGLASGETVAVPPAPAMAESPAAPAEPQARAWKNWPWYALGGAAVVLLGFVGWRRGRKSESAEDRPLASYGESRPKPYSESPTRPFDEDSRGEDSELWPDTMLETAGQSTAEMHSDADLGQEDSEIVIQSSGDRGAVRPAADPDSELPELDESLLPGGAGLDLDEKGQQEELVGMWEDLDMPEMETEDDGLGAVDSYLSEQTEDEDQSLEIVIEMAKAYVELGDREEAIGILEQALASADSDEKRARLQAELEALG